MTTDNNLRDALLRENGISHGGLSSNDRAKLDKILERDRARLRHTKRIVLTAWGMLAIGCFFAYVSQFDHRVLPHWLGEAGPLLYMALTVVAWVYLVGFVVRWLKLKDCEKAIHRVEVEARLARIEKALHDKLGKDYEA